MQDITQIINASKVYATHKMSQKEIFSTLILNVQHTSLFLIRIFEFIQCTADSNLALSKGAFMKDVQFLGLGRYVKENRT